MGYSVGKESVYSTQHQSPKTMLPKRYGLRSIEGDCSTNNHPHQQRHQVVQQDCNGGKKTQSQCVQGFMLPAPRSTRFDLVPSCYQNTQQNNEFLIEDQSSLIEDSDCLVSRPLVPSTSCSSQSEEQQRLCLFDAAVAPPTNLSALFSDDPTWVGGSSKEYIWAPDDNKEYIWAPDNNSNSSSSNKEYVLVSHNNNNNNNNNNKEYIAWGTVGGFTAGVGCPLPVTPVGEFDNPLDNRAGTTVQTLFVSLTREPSDKLTVDVPQNKTVVPSSQKNIVDLIMAQLTDSNYGNNSNYDSNGSHTYEVSSTVPSTLPKSSTYPMEQLTIPCVTPFCDIQPLIDSRTTSPSDLFDYHKEKEPIIHEHLMRCEAPLAVGCSPPSSPLKKEYEGDFIPSDGGQNSSSTPGGICNRGNNNNKPTNVKRNSSSRRRSSQLNQLSPNIPLMPVVDITTLSNLHRSTSQALHVKAMIKKSHPGALLKASEWPPQTSDDVVSLLKQYRGKELLRHLRVVSFARKNAECVRELFESWCGKGIPPSDVLFGSYYLYVMKRGNRELCLKHNGRGRVTGHGRGCDYALKGPSFRCRYRHACLFCNAGDHGWFDEEHCERYLNLQKEMIQLGVTDTVALVLLDALERDDHSNFLGNIR